MSSSKKKQLRKGQYMTERQAAAASEAKKLKRVTLTFWVIIALVVCIFIGAVAYNPVKNVLYKNVKAVQVGDHTLNAVQLNYFYMDAISSWVDSYGSYASLFGLDTATALDKQYVSDDTTWADYFVNYALSTAKSTYALYDAAVAAGHTLTEDEEAEITSAVNNTWIYAILYYGYSDLDSYLKGVYGNGANQENYTEYLRVSKLATSYYNYYYDKTEADIAADADARDTYQADIAHTYNSYSFSSYYVGFDLFLEDSTTATDEEKEAAREAAREAAEALAAGTYESLDDFNQAIKELDAQLSDDVTSAEDSEAKATEYTDILYSVLASSSTYSEYLDWVIGKTEKANADEIEDEAEKYEYLTHQVGDITTIAHTTGSGDSEVTNGYYVVRFEGYTKNDFLMKNVRDILISFDAEDEDDPTDEEKAAALAIAEKLLAKWEAGDKDEDSFADLVDTDTDDSVTDNGLLEDVYPGQYDSSLGTSFGTWCYDTGRQKGDCEIILCDDGYHLVFFVGDGETTYRDSMIIEDLLDETINTWHTDLVAAVEATLLTDRFVNKSLVLGS